MQHGDFLVQGSYVQMGLLLCKGTAMMNFSSQAFTRKEGRTHLSLHSDFTVRLAHLVLLQWLQAEKGKESTSYWKSQASPWVTALHAWASEAALPSKLQYIPKKTGQWWDLTKVRLSRCYTWSNLLGISIPPLLQALHVTLPSTESFI